MSDLTSEERKLQSYKSQLLDAVCSCDLLNSSICSAHVAVENYEIAMKRHTNALVAGTYGACAKHWPHPRWKQCACGHKIIGKNFALQWAQHIRSLAPADATQELERRLAEAERKGRLEEAKRARHHPECLMRNYDGSPTGLECNCERGARIAELSQATKEAT